MYLICQCNVIILCKVFSIVIAVRTKFREFGLGTMSVFNNLKLARAVYTTVYIILIKSSFDENSINNITHNEVMNHTGILSNR